MMRLKVALNDHLHMQRMTAKELGERTGISTASLSRWLNDKASLSEVHFVTLIQWLLAEEDEEVPWEDAAMYASVTEGTGDGRPLGTTDGKM